MLGVTALVPLMTNQVQSLAFRVPYWIGMLATNEQVARWDAQYNLLETAQRYLASGGPGARICSEASGGLASWVGPVHFLRDHDTGAHHLLPSLASRHQRGHLQAGPCQPKGAFPVSG